VDVSVSSIASGNSARELFGSEEGEHIYYGRLEQASAGTLFLDEVADMDMEAQAQLLGALDTGSFVRVGGSEPVEVDVRIIAATHRNLEEAVKQGKFREDLFFHLNVVPLQIPPLREHHEDIPDLLNYYTNLLVDQEKLPYRHFSLAAQNRLRNYEWYGNIRELTNLVQHLLITAAGNEISLEEVEEAIAQKGSKPIHDQGMSIAYDLPMREARERFERDYLIHHLIQSGGSVGKVAKLIGMERTHLYRKLRALDIDPKTLILETS
jgi:DNA-binding NtrC family response regulator